MLLPGTALVQLTVKELVQIDFAGIATGKIPVVDVISVVRRNDITWITNYVQNSAVSIVKRLVTFDIARIPKATHSSIGVDVYIRCSVLDRKEIDWCCRIDEVGDDEP